MACTYCGRPIKARGLCIAHYKKLRKYGDPLAGRTILRGATLAEQYWAKVDRRGPDECWPWLSSRNPKGYGVMSDGHRSSQPAHRFGYVLAHGPIPDGLTVDHLCHTVACTLGNACPHRACQNPAHLQVLSHIDNARRGTSMAAINRRKTHCKRGHELSAVNIYEALFRKRGYRACKLCAQLRSQQQTQERREARQLLTSDEGR